MAKMRPLPVPFALALLATGAGTGLCAYLAGAGAVAAVVGGVASVLLAGVALWFALPRSRSSHVAEAEHYRRMMDAVTDLVVAGDMDAGVFYVSPSCRKLLGFTPEELIGTTPEDMVHPEDLPLARDAIVEAMQDRGLGPLRELRIRCADGGYKPFECLGQSYLDEGGRRVMMVVHRDISDRKRAEAAFKASEQNLRLISEHAPDYISRLNRDGCVTYVNHAAPGFTVEKMLGVHLTRWFEEEFHEPLMQAFRAALETGASESCEARGAVTGKWYVNRFSPIAVDGDIDGVIMIATDISDRKQAEEALRRSEERWRSLVENASAIILTVDRNLRVLATNRTLSGRTVEEVVGTDITDVLDGPALERVRDAVQRAYEKAETVEYDAAYTPPGRAPMWFSTRVGPVFEQGRIVAAAIIATDITRQVQMREALRRQNRALQAITEIGRAQADAEDEQALLSDLCRILVETADYRLAWVGMVERNEAKSVRPVAQWGFEDGYLEQAKISWGDNERGQGPTGRAIRSGEPDMARDIPNDPRFAPWREAAAARGYASSLSLPLRGKEGVFGALNVYATEPDAFDEEEVRLLSGLADDAAFGAMALRERREKEEADRRAGESRQRLAQVIETSAEAVVVADAKGRITEWNPAAERIFDWSREEVLGRPVVEVVAPPRLRETHSEGFRRAVAEPRQVRPRRFETTGLRRDGREFPIEIAVSALHEAGETYIAAFLTDVSERHQARRAVERRQALEELVLEISSRFAKLPPEDVGDEILRALEQAGRFLDADRSYLFQYSKDGRRMTNTHEWCAPNIAPQIHDLQDLPCDSIPWFSGFMDRREIFLAPLVEDLPAEAWREQEIFRSGGIRSLLCAPMVGSDRLVGFIGFDMVKAEREWTDEEVRVLRIMAEIFAHALLRRREHDRVIEALASYRDIFNGVTDAIYIQDADGIFLDVNDAVENMYGYGKDEVIGRTPAMLQAPGMVDMEATLAHVEKAFAGEPQTFEWWGRRKNGEVFPKEVSLTRGAYFGRRVVIALARDITERKRTENALRESEARLRQAQKIAGLGHWSWDVRSGRIAWSDETYELFGLTQGGFDETYEGFLSALHPDDREAVVRAVRFSVEQHEPYVIDFRVLQPGGRTVHIHAIGEVEYDRDGPLRMFGTVQDITDQKIAEQSVRESELRYKRLSEATFEGIAFHEDSRIIDCNRAFCDMLRWPREELIGGNVLSLVVPESWPELMRRITEQSEEPYEVIGLRRDGTTFPAEIQARMVHTEGRNLRVGAVRDLTERKHAEEALGRSQRSLAEAQRIARLGNWNWDIVENTIAWSDEVYRIFGLDADRFEATLEAFLASVHPDDRETVERRTMAAVYDGAPYDIDHRIVLPGGEIRFVHEQGEVLRDERGDAVRMIGTVHDITERKKAEEAVRRLNEDLERRVEERTRELSVLNRELESFAYTVSHDLRAPLRSIRGFCRALEEDCGRALGEAGRDHIERVSAAASRMGAMIDGLMELSRVSRSELTRRRVNLGALVRECIDELRIKELGRSVDVVIADPPSVEGDPALIRALLENLLGNAWKFTAGAKAPRIEFGCDLSSAPTEFFVRDNGVGFLPEEAEKLFEPFRRGESAAGFEGSGIGLATVQRIVALHGGTIRAEGAPGRGACFRFTLKPSPPPDESE